MRASPLFGISVVQLILFLAHWFIFRTWVDFGLDFWPTLGYGAQGGLRLALLILAFSFVPAALLSFRISNPLLTLYYRVAAVWLGFANFFFLAAVLSWPAWWVARLANVHAPASEMRFSILAALTLLALLTGVYGLVNARWIRIRRVSIRLPNLPGAWKGRRAVLMSDLHLGNVNGARFSRRIARIASGLKPDIVFLPGDLFDGTAGDFDRMIAPLRELAPPLGIYFSTGNHEEFGDPAHYLAPIARAGIQVLANECVMVDGLQIAGVSYGASTLPIRLRTALDRMNLAALRPSILLNHVPGRLPLVERSGVSLQLSGHTHGGQIFPYTWLTRRIFGPFIHGLHRLGDMQVYTSTGVGTWGPPMRVGTQPELVVLEFE